MLSVWPYKQGRKPFFLQEWLGNWWPFAEPNGFVLVTEVATARTVFRIPDFGARYVLSDDGNTLLAMIASDGDKPGTLAVYDVPGRPSPYAVIGIPLGLGLAGLLVRWRLKRRKARQVMDSAKVGSPL